MNFVGLKKQRGLSAVSVIAAILIGWFVFICGYKTLPAYYDTHSLHLIFKSKCA